MSMYLLPKTVINQLDSQRRKLLWQGGGQKKQYHLVWWEVLCKSKKKDGLGIKNIKKLNISFLCKWWWKLEHEEGLWQNLVQEKYLRGALVSTVSPKMGDSPIWTDMLKIRHIYLRGRRVVVKNGQ